MKRSSLTACLLIVSGIARLPVAHANQRLFNNQIIEPGEFSDTHAEFDTGLKMQNKGSARILVGMRFHGLHENGAPGSGWRLFWVDAEVGVTPAASGAERFQDYSLRISPFMYITDEDEDYDTSMRGAVKVFTADISKNINADFMGYTFKVFEGSLSGKFFSSREWELPQEERGFTFMSCVFNALGYGFAKQLSVGKWGQGVYIGGLGITVGHEAPIGLGLPRSVHFKVALDGGINAGFSHFDLNGSGEAAVIVKSRFSEGAFFMRAGADLQVVSYPGRSEDDAGRAGSYLISGLRVLW